LNPGAKFVNEAIFFLAEYNRRGKLKELGYTDSISNLDELTGDMFCVIADEIASLEEEQRQKQSKRGR